MKKKLCIITLFILVLAKLSYAQMHFGGTMIATTGGFRHLALSNDFTSTSKFGGFVLPRLAIGPQVEIGKSEVFDHKISTKYNRFSFGPFARFYFKNDNRLKVFGETCLAISKTNGGSADDVYEITSRARTFNAGAGINLFITRKFAAELSIYYNSFAITGAPTRDFIVFNFGVAGFFGGSCSDGAFY
jgi:hypothetical protein